MTDQNNTTAPKQRKILGVKDIEPRNNAEATIQNNMNSQMHNEESSVHYSGESKDAISYNVNEIKVVNNSENIVNKNFSQTRGNNKSFLDHGRYGGTKLKNITLTPQKKITNTEEISREIQDNREDLVDIQNTIINKEAAVMQPSIESKQIQDRKQKKIRIEDRKTTQAVTTARHNFRTNIPEMRNLDKLPSKIHEKTEKISEITNPISPKIKEETKKRDYKETFVVTQHKKINENSPKESTIKVNKRKAQIEFSNKTRKISPSHALHLDLITEDKSIAHKFGEKRRFSNKTRTKKEGAISSHIIREVQVGNSNTIQDLATRMACKTWKITKILQDIDVPHAPNDVLDMTTASLIVESLGHRVKQKSTEADIKELLSTNDTKRAIQLKTRPPIITIMGHVDHGKTSLLDALRTTDLASKESGGITQHIGAYQVQTEDQQIITFIDTPGHEAFSAMRSRGAQITDIIILVVAVNDGVKSQTIEAIEHAKLASVPVIVAITKVDKPNTTNFDHITRSLCQYDLIPESMGGDIIVVPVSAHTKAGLKELEEAILLQAELMELKADINCNAQGRIIEARMDKERGIVATFLVQQGVLNTGNIALAGKCYGSIRAMYDYNGQSIKSAMPSTPVEVLGLGSMPYPGDKFDVVKNDKIAKKIIEHRIQQEKESLNTHKIQSSPITLQDIFLNNLTEKKGLNIILKGDMSGSLEAITKSLNNFDIEEINLRILTKSIGDINESDITLASASEAIIIGFNVKVSSNILEIAKKFKVIIKTYSVIYALLDEVKDLMSGLLAPLQEEVTVGKAEILQIFSISRLGNIAGCSVLEGSIKSNARIRVFRNGTMIHDGKIKSLKHTKENAKEIKSGFECGILIEDFDKIQERDIIHAYEIKETKRKI